MEINVVNTQYRKKLTRFG